MIRTLLLLLLLVSLAAPQGATAQTAQKGKTTVEPQKEQKPAKQVTLYYFHVTRRCPTCLSVEKVSKDFIANTYAKNARVSFKTANVEEDENTALAEKYQAAGSMLLVVCGDKTEDLTVEGFRYARNDPKKLEARLQESIEKFLK